MGFTTTDLRDKLIICKRGESPTETTYYVDGSPFCLRTLSQDGKDEQYCSQIAGHGTDHTEEGDCKYHWGNAGRKPVTGRYAHVTKRRLKKNYDEFFNDPDILNLTPELNLQRTLLAEIVLDLQNDGSINYKKLMMALSILRDVGATVERIAKIESQQTMTVAKVRLIMALAIPVIRDFIDEEQLTMFIMAWKDQVQARGLLQTQDLIIEG